MTKLILITALILITYIVCGVISARKEARHTINSYNISMAFWFWPLELIDRVIEFLATYKNENK